MNMHPVNLQLFVILIDGTTPRTPPPIKPTNFKYGMINDRHVINIDINFLQIDSLGVPITCPELPPSAFDTEEQIRFSSRLKQTLDQVHNPSDCLFFRIYASSVHRLHRSKQASGIGDKTDRFLKASSGRRRLRRNSQFRQILGVEEISYKK